MSISLALMLQRGVGWGPRRVLTAGCAPPGARHGPLEVPLCPFLSHGVFTEQPPSQD